MDNESITKDQFEDLIEELDRLAQLCTKIITSNKVKNETELACIFLNNKEKLDLFEGLTDKQIEEQAKQIWKIASWMAWLRDERHKT